MTAFCLSASTSKPSWRCARQPPCPCIADRCSEFRGSASQCSSRELARLVSGISHHVHAMSTQAPPAAPWRSTRACATQTGAVQGHLNRHFENSAEAIQELGRCRSRTLFSSSPHGADNQWCAQTLRGQTGLMLRLVQATHALALPSCVFLRPRRRGVLLLYLAGSVVARFPLSTASVSLAAWHVQGA